MSTDAVCAVGQGLAETVPVYPHTELCMQILAQISMHGYRILRIHEYADTAVCAYLQKVVSITAYAY